MDERRRRNVELRKPDALFCMRCVETYSLVAQHFTKKLSGEVSASLLNRLTGALHR